MLCTFCLGLVVFLHDIIRLRASSLVIVSWWLFDRLIGNLSILRCCWCTFSVLAVLEEIARESVDPISVFVAVSPVFFSALSMVFRISPGSSVASSPSIDWESEVTQSLRSMGDSILMWSFDCSFDLILCLLQFYTLQPKVYKILKNSQLNTQLVKCTQKENFEFKML